MRKIGNWCRRTVDGVGLCWPVCIELPYSPIAHKQKRQIYNYIFIPGSMLVNLLVPGTVKSFGVLFVEFLEAFDATPSSAAWIPALCYFLYSSLGTISHRVIWCVVLVCIYIDAFIYLFQRQDPFPVYYQWNIHTGRLHYWAERLLPPEWWYPTTHLRLHFFT